jgi:hypothetical protein
MRSEKAPRGWPAALVLFHLGMWRERLRNAFADVAGGKSFAHPPEEVDELNDAELPQGIGTPLADAAGRCDLLLGELIDLYARLGDRPFTWYVASNTTEALLRNSYTHPRVHLSEYWKENGFLDRAATLWTEAQSDLQATDVSPRFVALAQYNLACVRVPQGELDEAMRLLEQAIPASDVLRANAPKDPDLAPLYDSARFKELVKA